MGQLVCYQVLYYFFFIKRFFFPFLFIWTQLMVWPEQSPEDMKTVTITPDYPSLRHTGLVSGLKKFTWYFGSTLCFTTPGDGPRSPPTLIQTHEDSEFNIIWDGSHCHNRILFVQFILFFGWVMCISRSLCLHPVLCVPLKLIDMLSCGLVFKAHSSVDKQNSCHTQVQEHTQHSHTIK